MKQTTRKNLHRALSLFLAMVMLMSLVNVTAFAAEESDAVLTCGKTEHTHSDACYGEEATELACGLEETEGHTHTDACYGEATTELACGKEESEGHVHGDGCYNITETRTLTCTEEERPPKRETQYDENGMPSADLPPIVVDEGHTHSDGCYSVETTKELICELPEAEGHTHTDACYTTTRSLICGQEEAEPHTHTEACYQRPLICGVPEHTHSEACYAVVGPEPEPEVETDETVQAVVDQFSALTEEDVNGMSDAYTAARDAYFALSEEQQAQVMEILGEETVRAILLGEAQEDTFDPSTFEGSFTEWLWNVRGYRPWSGVTAMHWKNDSGNIVFGFPHLRDENLGYKYFYPIYCLQPAAEIKSGYETGTETNSDLTPTKIMLVGLILKHSKDFGTAAYYAPDYTTEESGYHQINKGQVNLFLPWMASQILIWEAVDGCRNEKFEWQDGGGQNMSYTKDKVLGPDGISSQEYKNVFNQWYDDIVGKVKEDLKQPSFTSSTNWNSDQTELTITLTADGALRSDDTVQVLYDGSVWNGANVSRSEQTITITVDAVKVPNPFNTNSVKIRITRPDARSEFFVGYANSSQDVAGKKLTSADISFDVPVTIDVTKPLGSLTITKAVVVVDGDSTAATNKTYTFEVTYPDGTKKNVTATATQPATLKDLEPGVYTVTEDEAGAKIDGYTVQVTGDGSATVTAGGEASVTVTNTYKKATPTTWAPKIEKNVEFEDLSDPDLANRTFTFTLTNTSKPDGATTPGNQTVTFSGSNLLDGKTDSQVFPAVELDAPGTYTFKISETGDIDGHYAPVDAQDITVVVTHDQNNNTLEVKSVNNVDYDPDATVASFTNIFSLGKVNVTVPVTKTILGDTPASKVPFTFTIKKESAEHDDGYKMPENTQVTITGAGEGKFDPITFSKTGTYTFLISEVPQTGDQYKGYTFDKYPWKVTVTVTQDTQYKDPISGSTYYALNAECTVEQVATSPVKALFSLMGLAPRPVPSSAATFTNTYQKTTWAPSVQKIVNTTEKAPATDDEFTFALTNTTTEGKTNVVGDDSQTVTVTGATTEAFDGYTFYAPGEYTFEIKETDAKAANSKYSYDSDESTWTATVEVEADEATSKLSVKSVTYKKDNAKTTVANNTVPFTNTKLTTITLSLFKYAKFGTSGENAVKVPLAGAEFGLYKKVAEGQYEEVKDTEGKQITEVTGADGEIKIQLGSIPCVDADKYYFKELKAPAGFKLVETFIQANAQNADWTGSCELENEGTFTPNVYKIASDGNKIGLGGAEFTLYYKQSENVADYTVIASYTTGEDGKLDLPALGNGWYKLVETKAPDGFQAPTENSYVEFTVTVRPEGGADVTKEGGSIAIENRDDVSYGYNLLNNVKKVNLSVTKVLDFQSDAEGKNIVDQYKNHKFHFVLTGTGKNGEVITREFDLTANPIEKANTKEFKNLPAGEYTLTETNFDLPDFQYLSLNLSGSNTVEEITEGDTSRSVKFTLTGDEKDAEITFTATNKYEVNKASLEIQKVVTLDGKPVSGTGASQYVAGKTFTFTVTGVDPNGNQVKFDNETSKKVTITVGEDGTGKAMIENIPVGTYTITESGTSEISNYTFSGFGAGNCTSMGRNEDGTYYAVVSTLGKTGTVNFTATNNYKLKDTRISITKDVELDTNPEDNINGNEVAANEYFTFAIVGTDLNNEDHVYINRIHPGQTWTQNIPRGTYKVIEVAVEAPSYYEYRNVRYSIGSVAQEIQKGPVSIGNVTKEYDYIEIVALEENGQDVTFAVDAINSYARKLAPLSITKTVINNNGDLERPWNFDLTLTAPTGYTLADSYEYKITKNVVTTDEEGNQITSTEDVSNGKLVPKEVTAEDGTTTTTWVPDGADHITLTHGQTITIEGLYVGTTYSVTEVEAGVSSYNTRYTNGNGEIPEAGIEVAVENRWSPSSTNREATNAVTWELNGTKLLDSVPAEGERFTFTVDWTFTAENGTVTSGSYERRNNGGNIPLVDTQTYDTPEEVGTYVYTIREKAENDDGIIYDDVVYTVTVKVTSSSTTAGNLTTTTYARDVTMVDDTGSVINSVVFNNSTDTTIPDDDIPLEEFPDDDIPLADLPDDDIPLVEFPDEDVPLTEIPDDDVPLTGDNSRKGLWLALAICSAFGMAITGRLLKSKEEDQENGEN